MIRATRKITHLRPYATSPLAGNPPKIPITVVAEPVIVQKRVSPVIVVDGTGGLPPPPPPPPPKQGRPFTRFLVWSGLITAAAYGTSTYLALHNDEFEQLYTQYVPGAERLVDYAQSKELDRVGLSDVLGGLHRVVESSKNVYNQVSGSSPSSSPSTTSTASPVVDRVQALQKSVAAQAETVRSKAASLLPADSESPKALGDDARAAHFEAVDDSKLLLERPVDKTEEIKQEAAKRAKAVQDRAGAVVEGVKKDAREVKEVVLDQAGKLVDASERKIEEAKEVVERKAGEAKAKAVEVREAAERKAVEVREAAEKKAHETKHAVERSTAEAKSVVDRKAAEAKQAVELKTEEAKHAVDQTTSDAKSLAQRTSTETQAIAHQAENALVRSATDAQHQAAELANDVSAQAHRLSAKAAEFVEQLKATVEDKFDAVVGEGEKAKEAIEHVDLKAHALSGIDAIKAQGGLAVEKAKEVVDAVAEQAAHLTGQSAHLAHQAEDSVEKKTGEWSEGVEDLVHQAEDALKTVVTEGLKEVDGKKPWTGPLPLGFEAPPGYYLPKPTKAAASGPSSASQVAQMLPLIAPSVRSFSSSEPIITQLASTIDSLAAYLSSTPSAVPSAKNLISTAQMDLEALGNRLATVKEDERKKLEAQLELKRVEFENELQARTGALEAELEKREEGWKEVVEDERAKLVGVFRERLENELEVQSEIINARLKEEVLAQAVELQQTLIKDIKTQVETERGGRLAKLGELETGLKGLEKVTLDNSAILDENVRVHTLWSALRAVQTASDVSRQPFDSQLAALTTLTTESSDPSASPTVLASIPSSTVIEGIESTTDLTYWFIHRVAPRIRSVALVPETADAGLLSHLTSYVLSPLLFRKSGEVEGTDVGSVLARAEDKLARKDLDGAAREVNSLKGWPATLAADWLREARKRLEVEQALDIVSTEATLASLLVAQ